MQIRTTDTSAAIALAVFFAATFSAAAKAEDAAERSPESQVLNRFVGTWDLEVTSTTPGKQSTTQKGVETRKWSRGGRFVQFENPDQTEFHMLMTWDPVGKAYSGVFMSGPNRTLIAGAWDEPSLTMTFSGTDTSGGNKFVFKHRFIDADHAHSSGSITNADGDVVLKTSYKQTRRALVGPAESQDPASERSPELEVLNRFVGDWNETVVQKPAAWTPEGRTITATGTRKWILNGHMIENKGVWSPGSDTFLHLTTYDAAKREYRQFYFDRNDPISQNESRGKWDAATKTLTFKGKMANGEQSLLTQHFIDDNTFTWTWVVKDQTDKVVLDMEGRCVRKK